jgi:thioredoxin reductase/Fe-S-cluster-containing hydrogenase component 2
VKKSPLKNPQLLVIGGGPAGLGAAIEAARRGLKVVLIDEGTQAGGQLFKQIHRFFGSKEHMAGTRGFQIGRELLDEAHKWGVETLLSSRVVGIFPDRRVSILFQDKTIQMLKPDSIIIATGGGEKGIAFPGWTLPGVMTAGAAQTCCNIHRYLPGKRVVVLGSGNVGLIVAYQLLQAGAEVPCVLESREFHGGYQVHAEKLLRAGVAIRTGYTVKEAVGVEHIESVRITAVDSDCRPRPGSEELIAADTLCIAVGLRANARLADMAGCEMVYCREFGDILPLHGPGMETSIPGIFIAGDAAGIEEANTALEEGRIAGISAASFLGSIPDKAAKLDREEVWQRLNALRGGSFGKMRRLGKHTLLHFYDSSPKLGNLAQEPDNYCSDQAPGETDLALPKFGSRPIAVIACDQDIPCNPCVAVCPVHAISMEPDIIGIPKLNRQLCTGCGACLVVCPGQAITLFQERYNEERSALTFVYELLPLPKPGTPCRALDRHGRFVCDAEVVKVRSGKKLEASNLITIAFPREYAQMVRFMERQGEGIEADG